MDKIRDHYAREGSIFSPLQRILENWGRTISGHPYVNLSDNYGNTQLGHTIRCASGDMIKLSHTDFMIDQITMSSNIELLEYNEIGATYSLGHLDSPLQTRCNDTQLKSR